MLQVVADPETLRRSGSGNITGVVYIMIGGEPFPESHWDDFAPQLLTRWSAAVIRLARGFSRRERLDFMDGPYVVHIDLALDGLEVRGLRNQRQVIRAHGPSDTEAMVRSCAAAVDGVLAACRAHGWESADLDDLAVQASVLRTL